MMYLLAAKPEMLLSGSRITLFIDACKKISNILQGDNGASPLDKKQLMEKIIDKAEKSEMGFLHEAWLLAEALMQLGDDDDKMWKVIRGVWVEMLCFSAGRCRGYLHAKSLCAGGGVPHLCVPPDVTGGIGDFPGQAAEGEAWPSQRAEGVYRKANDRRS
jgi:hypothetical protein